MEMEFTNTAMLGPIFAQIALTLIVFVILMARRLPAMAAAKPTPEQMQDKGNLGRLPAPARFAAENYNHQFEMPVLFYVLCLTALVSGLGGALCVTLAWIYVVLRMVHSVIHCTYNNVMHRFLVFAISAFVLMAILGMMALEFWGIYV